jgi:hypothetical protein
VLFKYWNYTTCIHSDNLDAIEREITLLLDQEEGTHRLYRLPQLSCNLEELHSRSWDKLPNLSIVGLFGGSGGWTIVKTFPIGLLCGRGRDRCRPRLSVLAMNLGCDAFHLEVHDAIEGFLLEANAAGYTLLSGCPGEEAPDNFQFYEETVNIPDLIQQFSLLQVPQALHAAIRINQDPEIQAIKALANRLWPEYPNSEILLELMELAFQGHTQLIDNALRIEIACGYWGLNNLPYYAYAKEISRSEPTSDLGDLDRLNLLPKDLNREREKEALLLSQLTKNQVEILRKFLDNGSPQEVVEDRKERLLFFHTPSKKKVTRAPSVLNVESNLSDLIDNGTSF